MTSYCMDIETVGWTVNHCFHTEIVTESTSKKRAMRMSRCLWKLQTLFFSFFMFKQNCNGSRFHKIITISLQASLCAFFSPRFCTLSPRIACFITYSVYVHLLRVCLMVVLGLEAQHPTLTSFSWRYKKGNKEKQSWKQAATVFS